jgi:hypothetical protein
MLKPTLIAKIVDSKKEIGEAQAALDKLLRELQIAPRAEKSIASGVIEAALAKLRIALANLGQLESLAEEDDPED